MSHETVLTSHYVEKQTAKFTAVLKDEDGTLVAGSELVTMTLYLYNQDDKAILNSRDGSDILNTNGGAIDESGNFSLVLAPDDMPIVDDDNLIETHVAEIHWTYNGGARAGAHRIFFPVYNLEKTQ